MKRIEKLVIQEQVNKMFQKKEGAMLRSKANKEIMKKLTKAMKANPQVRFGQLLRNLGVVTEIRDQNHNVIAWQNDFNKESEAILDTMNYCEDYA